MKIEISEKKTDLVVANTFIKRLKGLMFKRNIKYGMIFNKCNSIHTFCMFSHIDVLMLDKDDYVLFVYKNFLPNRIILPKKNVVKVIELPPQSIKGNLVGKKATIL